MFYYIATMLFASGTLRSVELTTNSNVNVYEQFEAKYPTAKVVSVMSLEGVIQNAST